MDKITAIHSYIFLNIFFSFDRSVFSPYLCMMRRVCYCLIIFYKIRGLRYITKLQCHCQSITSILTEIRIVDCLLHTIALLKFLVDATASPSRFYLSMAWSRQPTTSNTLVALVELTNRTLIFLGIIIDL